MYSGNFNKTHLSLTTATNSVRHWLYSKVSFDSCRNQLHLQMLDSITDEKLDSITDEKRCPNHCSAGITDSYHFFEMVKFVVLGIFTILWCCQGNPLWVSGSLGQSRSLDGKYTCFLKKTVNILAFSNRLPVEAEARKLLKSARLCADSGEAVAKTRLVCQTWPSFPGPWRLCPH